MPGYKDLRYEEDYTYLFTNPSLRTDPWDRIKFMPLWWLDQGYLSLGGEVRERYEFYHDENFGSAPADRHGNNGYLLERYLLHGDLHLSPFLRFFGQFQSGLEDGRIGGPRPDIDRNAFDVHQAFFDFMLPFDDMKDSLTWRVGRQEMSYGTGRLIDTREGVNLRRSFDEVRLLLKADQWQVDGWWGKPVRNRPGVFDDDPNPNVSFWGLYAVHPFPVLPKGNVDLYYLGFENKQAVYDQGKGYELRHSLGTRLWGRPLPWEYNFEYVWQFGTFGQGTIMAWTAANAVRYNFDLPFKPSFGVRADVASGDSNPNSPNLQTFNPLFPSGAYFNLANPIGPSNIIDLHPVLTLHPTDKVTFIADWDFFWRESLNDGLYTLAVTPLRTGRLSNERFVGSSPSLTVAWTPTRHITILTSYVHFFAGPFLKETPPGKDMDYVTVWMDYKF